MKEIDAQLKRAQGRLAREVAQAVGGIQSAYLAAQAKEQKLREQFQLQQDAVLNLKDLSGQYIKLDQAVTTTRALHATLLQRLQETDVVKGAQLSNATVVDPAERPTTPSQPDVPFNLTFGLLFGGGLGLALAFARENIDGSLKTPDDVRARSRAADARRGAGLRAPLGLARGGFPGARRPGAAFRRSPPAADSRAGRSGTTSRAGRPGRLAPSGSPPRPRAPARADADGRSLPQHPDQRALLQPRAAAPLPARDEQPAA